MTAIDTICLGTMASTDILAIRDLTHRYSHLVDHSELEPLMQLWTNTAELDQRPVGLPHLVGLPAIRAFFIADFAATRTRVHAMCNHLIWSDGPNRAVARCYAMVEAETETGDGLTAAVEYADVYDRTAKGGWLFASRTISPLRSINLGTLAESVRT